MKNKIGMWIYVLVLTIASAFVVFDSAAAEPYILFRYSDAFVQIGIAVALMVLWLQFSVWLSYAAITRRVPRLTLALIIWAGIAVFNLWQSPVAYVGDITKFVIEKQ